MALVALASVKGAPGVTTTAVTIAAVWPEDRHAALVELDPAGGDVAARFGLTSEPSLVTLAAAVGRGKASADDGSLLLQHCHRLPGGLQVVAGATGINETRASLDILADTLALLGAGADVDIIADCGRLQVTSLLAGADDGIAGRAGRLPTSRILRQAERLLVVAHNDLAELAHVADSLPALRALNAAVDLILVGPGRYQRTEVVQALGVEVIGELPIDHAAAAIVGGRPHRGNVARLPLFRAADSLVKALVTRLPMPTTAALVEAAPSGGRVGAAVLEEATG